MTHSGCISSSQMHNISEQMCKSQIEMNGNYDTKPKKNKNEPYCTRKVCVTRLVFLCRFNSLKKKKIQAYILMCFNSNFKILTQVKYKNFL